MACLIRLFSVRPILFYIGVICLLLSPGQQVFADDFTTDNSAAQSRHTPDVKAWKSSRAKGQKALGQKHYAEAETFFKAALDQAVNFDPKDDRLAESLLDLAVVYFDTGNYAAAEPLCRQAADIRHGAMNPNLEAECLNLLVMTAARLGHYDEAVKACQREEEILSRKMGANQPLIVQLRFERGLIFYDEGDYAQAEPLLKSSAFFFEHPVSSVEFRGGLALMPVLANAAVVYSKLGRDTDLISVYQRQISVCEQLFGPNNTGPVKPLTDCAALLRKQNRVTEAAALEDRAAAIQAAHPK